MLIRGAQRDSIVYRVQFLFNFFFPSYIILHFFTRHFAYFIRAVNDCASLFILFVLKFFNESFETNWPRRGQNRSHLEFDQKYLEWRPFIYTYIHIHTHTQTLLFLVLSLFTSSFHQWLRRSLLLYNMVANAFSGASRFLVAHRRLGI